MKRRAFLSLLGAAGAAPVLPTLPRAAGAGYSRTLFSRAVMHACMKQHLSARGLAARFGMPLPQAQAIMSEMANRGIVRPVVGGAGVHVRAVNAIVAAPGGAGAAHSARRAGRVWSRSAVRATWLSHLHDLCRARGLHLSDRALAQVSA